MFEPLEDFLNNNKEMLPDDGKENRPRHSHKFGDIDDVPNPDEIARALERALGGGVKAHVLSIGKGSEGKMGIVNEDKLKDHFLGMFNSLLIIGKGAKVKPVCLDAVGKALAVGDYLKCPGNQKKAVLEVGYGFCRLSRTDDYKADDGFWIEPAIKRLNFIKE